MLHDHLAEAIASPSLVKTAVVATVVACLLGLGLAAMLLAGMQARRRSLTPYQLWLEDEAQVEAIAADARRRELKKSARRHHDPDMWDFERNESRP